MAESKIKASPHSDVIVIHHDAIPALGYGWIGFNLPTPPTGMRLQSLTPITKDPAITLCIGYYDGWRLVYQSAYNSTAGAGDFEVRYTYG